MQELSGRQNTGVHGNDIDSSFESVLGYFAVADSQLVSGNRNCRRLRVEEDDIRNLTMSHTIKHLSEKQ